MIWLHCGDLAERALTRTLAERLSTRIAASHILVTAPDHTILHDIDVPSGVLRAELLADTNTQARAFLNTYQPRSLIWIGGALMPVLLRNVEKAYIPANLINADGKNLFPRSYDWLPRAISRAMSPFRLILTQDGATATRLVKGKVGKEIVEPIGTIREETKPLVHDQNELSVMAEALNARPVWFADEVVEEEFDLMAKAHLIASRKNHSLLLVLMPRDQALGAMAANALRDRGLSVGLRSDGDDPEPDQQAYVVDFPEERGLWYRLSALSYMGGTLGSGGAVSPFDAVLLGSAVIHGPHKSPFEERYSRLKDVDAGREIRTATELGIAITTLISPEQTARLSLAGWDEVTRDANTLNRLVDAAVADYETRQ